MIKKNLAFIFRKYHKWIALVIGVQAVIWCVSGLYMTSIHIDIIHGDHLVKSTRIDNLPNKVDQELFAAFDNHGVQFEKLSFVNEQPVLQIVDQDKTIKVNLLTGKAAPQITEQDIRYLASRTYAGDAQLVKVELLASYPAEIGGRNQPVWKVSYDDLLSSTLYFNAQSAQLIRARSDLWRWFDFLWMLHIMDYESRENVNNNLLRVASTLGLILCLGGVGLLFYSFGHRKSKAVTAVGVLKTCHKWLALAIGIQLVLWMVTGIGFSLLDHEKVSGKYLVAAEPEKSIEFNSQQIHQILNRFSKVVSIRASTLDQKSVYQVNLINEVVLLDSASLQPITIAEKNARSIAKHGYVGEGKLASVELITTRTTENRKFSLPLWKVNFTDSENSSLYVNGKTGQIAGAKTDTWRLFDLFWMLHIMDYGERDDFNHALIIFAAAISSFVALSGFIMLFSVFSLKDLDFRNRFKPKRMIFQSKEGEVVEVNYRWFTRLVDLARKRKIDIRSDCGGGGSCGLCRIKLVTSSPISEADKRMLSSDQLEQGYRLSCQINLQDKMRAEMSHKHLDPLR